ncbi:hypothetical protein IV55_GL000633 [Furfurilactobacillus siliginis]|uniref:Gram-positive cocci surface proteins LPxTG domain-containing protein n=3 Tax=Furfurilactobacillus siliginis TaxID=348151 RepID=A0A0R2L5M2_9LACO|nr:hypothetical protein IV55_GL000633 [Furfurilactobacillus siliginis]
MTVQVGGNIDLRSLLISAEDGAGKPADIATLQMIPMDSFPGNLSLPSNQIAYRWLGKPFDINTPGDYYIEFAYGDPVFATAVIHVVDDGTPGTHGSTTGSNSMSTSTGDSTNTSGTGSTGTTSGAGNSANTGSAAVVQTAATTGTSTQLAIGGSNNVAKTSNMVSLKNGTALPETGESDTELLTTLGLTSVVTILSLLAAKKRRNQD